MTRKEDQIQERMPLITLTIQVKVRSFFQTIKDYAGDEIYTQTFTVSHGWFQRFRNEFPCFVIGQ